MAHWTTEILRNANLNPSQVATGESRDLPTAQAADRWLNSLVCRTSKPSLDATIAAYDRAVAERKAARDSEVRAALNAIRAAAQTVPAYGADLPTNPGRCAA